jgi:hypothetical protein
MKGMLKISQVYHSVKVIKSSREESEAEGVTEEGLGWVVVV